jgi:four helix bundle protein
MRFANDYSDLEVYKASIALSDMIFDISLAFPRSEIYSLTDQIRRSSRSIGAQISEAWAKRKYEKHFISKTTDAMAEAYETRHWIETARRCGYISNEESSALSDQCAAIIKMLSSMITKSQLFCKPIIN